MGKRKILLLYSSSTGGHKSASRSISEALEDTPGIDVDVINILDHMGGARTRKRHRVIHAFILNHIPRVRSWIFKHYFSGESFFYRASQTVIRLVFGYRRRPPRLLREKKPDIIVSCDSMVNALLSFWLQKGILAQPVHSMVTDYRAHRFWSQPRIDFYYVACAQTKRDLIRFGVRPERILITGIPVARRFTFMSGFPEWELRARLGIDPNRFLLLMMGGELGFGPFEEVAEALNPLSGQIQVAFMTGKNSSKRIGLIQTAKNMDLQIHALGYTRNIDLWIEASDAVITKPGGITVSEILVKGKPIIILTPRRFLEKIQAEFLAEAIPSVIKCHISELYDLIAKKALESTTGDYPRMQPQFICRDGAALRIAAHLQKQRSGRKIEAAPQS